MRAKANEAGAVIKEQAPIVRDKVVDAAGTAKDAAKDKVSSHSGPDQTAPYPQR